MEIVRGGDGGQVGEGDLVEDNGGEEEETKEESLEGGRRRSTTGYKRNYFWCPVVDCASGPVQKMGQHLVKVHKMDRATATRTAKKNTPEAIKLKLPNPARRSSGIKSISLFSTPAPSSSTPKPTSKTSGTHSKTTSSLALAHSGGPFLEEFQSHLKSHAGGYRSSSTATQLARDVGKYLYFLDQSKVNEALLLDTHPVEGYLQSLSASGMGPSGILHRLLSQKAATVSCPSHHSLGLGLGLICTTVLPHRWKMMHRYGRPTGACSTCRQSTNRTTERRPRRGATCSFKGPWRVYGRCPRVP